MFYSCRYPSYGTCIGLHQHAMYKLMTSLVRLHAALLLLVIRLIGLTDVHTCICVPVVMALQHTGKLSVIIYTLLYNGMLRCNARYCVSSLTRYVGKGGFSHFSVIFFTARCYALRARLSQVCRLFVCPYVTFRYRDHIGWNTSM